MSQPSDPPAQRSDRPARRRSQPNRLTCRISGSTVILTGEADAGTVESLTTCLEQAPSNGDIDLDLSGTTFLDSTALRVVLRFRTELAAHDRSLRVVDPSGIVMRMLQVTGLDDFLL